MNRYVRRVFKKVLSLQGTGLWWYLSHEEWNKYTSINNANWHYVYVSSDNFKDRYPANSASEFKTQTLRGKYYEVALLEVELTGDIGSADGFFVTCYQVTKWSRVGRRDLPVLRRVWFPAPPGCDTSAMHRCVTFQDRRYMPFNNNSGEMHFRLVDDKGNQLQLPETSQLSLLLHVKWTTP